MKKKYAYSVDFNEKVEKLFKKAEYLGQGNNGIVFELPENKVIKIFSDSKVCNDESGILIKTKGSKYFPKIFDKGTNYIIREKVEGERLDYYIKDNGLSEKLIRNIYSLLMEFKKLKFKKLDIRCKDIFVAKNEKIMIIDPKKSYNRKVDYPRHLMKGLMKLQVLNKFLDEIKEIDQKRYIIWKTKFEEYCENEIY